MLQSYVGLLPPVILKVSWTRHSKIHVKPDTKPIFWKPRTVLFALREAVDKELDRLERLNIISPVDCSEWACPIMVVPKADKSLRLW